MADTPEQPPAAQSTSRLGWIILAVVALAAVAAGFALPWMLSSTGTGHAQAPSQQRRSPEPEKTAFVPFGDVVVNLHEERLTRYLRLKIVLEVEESEEKAVHELLNKRRAPLKSWLIGYLADRTLDEVRGTVGINRIRREIRDHFNEMLYPDGREVIRQVHFEEFTVQ